MDGARKSIENGMQVSLLRIGLDFKNRIGNLKIIFALYDKIQGIKMNIKNV